MLIAIAGVIVGFGVWSAVWLGGNAALRASGLLPPDGQRVNAASVLAALLVLSIAASVASGITANRIAGAKATLELAILLLVVGAVVQFQLRDLMPVWYHLVFLLLIVPVTLLGGRLSL